MFIDPFGLRNITIVAGGDIQSNNNAFLNNAETWINDNMTHEDIVVIIDVGNNRIITVTMDKDGNITRDVSEVEFKNANDVFKAIKSSHADVINANSESGMYIIDELIFETHSGTDALYLRSDIHASTETIVKHLSDAPPADCSTRKLGAYMNLAPNAIIRFNGCNAGGRDGVKSNTSLAQQVANATGVTVYAYVNNTSQKREGNRYFQKPVRMRWGQAVVDEYTVFTKQPTRR